MEVPESSSLSVYAELLSHIRHISIVATLPSPPDRTTSAQISADGTKIQIRHGSSVKEVALPGQVSAHSSVLPVQSKPGSPTSLSWRLPVADSVPGNAHSDSNPVVPWTALDLVVGSSISCRSCSRHLVPEGQLKVWKDLPSENWAEMMDFWHCHKPDDDHGHGHGHSQGHDHDHLAQRGYGANSTIAAQPSVGFVDLTSFLLTESDCVGLSVSLCFCFVLPLHLENFSILALDNRRSYKKAAMPGLFVSYLSMAWLPILSSKSNSPALLAWLTEQAHSSSSGALDAAGESLRMLHVSCINCEAHVGYFNVAIDSVSLFKWQVLCETSSRRLAPSSSDCLAAALLATLARSGSSKSVVLPTIQPPSSAFMAGNGNSAHANGSEAVTAKAPEALHLWILNPNVAYSSSVRQGGPFTALKLFYKYVSQQQAIDMLESFTSDVQEVNLPIESIGTTAEILSKSGKFLPSTERVFKDWQVGLLDKWTD